MAYMLEIIIPKCVTCRAKAKVEIYNNYNSLVGSYCTAHGSGTLRELQAKEKERWKERL